MPLFECSKCGCVENTALGEYWSSRYDRVAPTCSECANGEWHGRFEKQTTEQAGYIHGETGYLYAPAELKRGGYFHGKDKPCKCGDVQKHYAHSSTGMPSDGVSPAREKSSQPCEVASGCRQRAPISEGEG